MLLLAPLLAAEPGGQLGLVFAGDSGTGGPAQLRVAQAMAGHCASQRCDLLLLLGDNVMPAGVSGVDDPQWRAKVELPYAPLGVPVRPVLGNHDHQGDPEASIAYSARWGPWDMPSAYYAFGRGPVSFYALDTERMDRRQRRWLARGLRRAEAPWIVVYGHHPLRSGGVHGPTRGAMRRVGRLVERHADFYLSGHDHHQQVIEGQAVHVVMGSGGSPPRAVEACDDTRYAASRRGFGHLLFTEDRAELTVVEANGRIRFVWEVERACAP